MKGEFKEAIELHNNGYSPEEIAEELGVSRASAYRWIKQHETSLALAGVSESQDDDDYEEEEDQFEEEGDEDDESESTLGRVAVALEKEHSYKRMELGRQSLESFHALLEGIQEHVTGSVWTKKELSKVVSKSRSIINMIMEAAHLDESLEYDELSIYNISSILQNIFNDYSSLFPDGVTISLDQPKLDLIANGLEILDFEDTSFDRVDFLRQAAWYDFRKYTSELISINGQLDPDEIDLQINEVITLREKLTDKLDEELEDEFDEEVDILEELEEFLNEYRIRQEESFWGKRFVLPADLIERIDEVAH